MVEVGLCPLFFRYLDMRALEVIDRVKGIIEPLLERDGLEVVDVEYRREPVGMVLRVYIDRPEGIDLGVCSEASSAIEAALDETDIIESAYNLEVSSPGVERRLVKPAHFQRFIGEEARLRLLPTEEGRKKFTGKIVEADDKAVALEVDGERLRFEYERIAKANLKYCD